MKIKPINQSYNFNFRNKLKTQLVSIEKHPDYEARVYETPASTAKKFGIGFASASIPGLGQAINGQWGKAAGFFFGELFGPTLIALPAALLEKDKTAPPKISLVLVVLSFLGIHIWDIVDAVKNAKTETVKIIPYKNIKTHDIKE